MEQYLGRPSMAAVFKLLDLGTAAVVAVTVGRGRERPWAAEVGQEVA